MTIEELINDAWQTSEDKGWHDRPRSLAEEIALMHSELSEALEAIRDGFEPAQIVLDADKGYKPEGIAAELADVLIRIADCCKQNGIPLERAIKAKLAYNQTRPYRHGGKAL